MTIKELRAITGLSQRAFGEKYHIPTRTIENWEGGTRKPSETILYLLERAVKEDYNMVYVIIYYVATCTLDEDGDIDWDSINPIVEYK